MAMFMQFIPFIGIIVVFYLFLIIPEKKRKKQYEEMINNLKVNDEILTRGGVIGKIITLKDDFIILESGPDRARLKFSKQAISTVYNNKED